MCGARRIGCDMRDGAAIRLTSLRQVFVDESCSVFHCGPTRVFGCRLHSSKDLRAVSDSAARRNRLAKQVRFAPAVLAGPILNVRRIGKTHLVMRPGQLNPNELELAILERLSSATPALRGSAQRLHVLSREFTGVGSFTKFQVDKSATGTLEQPLGLDALITVPGVPKGLGAVLFCWGDQPSMLEIYAFGNDHWDGLYDGFTIEPPA